MQESGRQPVVTLQEQSDSVWLLKNRRKGKKCGSYDFECDHRQGISTGCNQFYTSDILYYAQAYTEYQLSGNMGFPQDKSTDTISGFGSIVIPEDLTSNVSALHQFLYGVNDYSPSSKVNSISEKLLRGSAQVEMHRIQEIHREKVIHHPREDAGSDL